MSLPKISETALLEAVKMLKLEEAAHLTDTEFFDKITPIMDKIKENQPTIVYYFSKLFVTLSEIYGPYVPTDKVFMYIFIILQAYMNQDDIDSVKDMF